MSTNTANPVQQSTGSGTLKFTKDPNDSLFAIQLDGTQTGLQFTVVGTIDGSNGAVPLTVLDVGGNSGSTGSTTIAPADTASKWYFVPNVFGLSGINVVISAQTGGTANWRTFHGSNVGAFNNILNSAGQTFTGRVTAQLLNVGPAPTDTYSATMTIDVTKSSHIIAASNGTAAASTLTPSAAGNAGDLLTILTEADASGTVTVTFAATFHSSGTQATTASHFSSILFQSDGTRWLEIGRTTALT